MGIDIKLAVVITIFVISYCLISIGLIRGINLLKRSTTKLSIIEKIVIILGTIIVLPFRIAIYGFLIIVMLLGLLLYGINLLVLKLLNSIES